MRQCLVLLALFASLMGCRLTDKTLRGSAGIGSSPTSQFQLVFNNNKPWTNQGQIAISPSSEVSEFSLHSSMADCEASETWTSASDTNYSISARNASQFIYYRVKLESGYISPCYQIEIFHDDTPPSIPPEVHLEEPAGGRNSSTSPIINIDLPTDYTGIDYFEARVISSYAAGGEILSWTPIASGDQLIGVFSDNEGFMIEVRGVDKAGNTGYSAYSGVWTNSSLSGNHISAAGDLTTTDIVRVDFDGDGDQDFVACSGNDIGGFNGVKLYKNNGSNSYTAEQISGQQCTTIKVVDMDSDGDLDILFLNNKGENYGWIEKREFGYFTNDWGLLNAFSKEDFLDFDGDGDTDFFTASTDLELHLNTGSYTFTTQSVYTSYLYDIVAVDLDEDGFKDFVVTDVNRDIVWLKNDGTNTSFTPTIIDSSINFTKILVEDFDQDGDLDIVADGIQMYLFTNDGSENFVRTQILANPVGEMNFAVDLDGDNKIDIMNAGSNQSGWLKNNGGGSFTLQQPVAINVKNHLFVDLDNDTDIDIVDLPVGNLSFWFNDGSENFARQYVTNYLPAYNYQKTIDLDQDGDTDIINGYGEYLGWSENLGGNFVNHIIPISNYYVADFVASDLNDDGQIDIVFCDYYSNKIIWVRNDGGGNFTPIEVATTTQPLSLAVADIDKINGKDIAVTHYTGEVAWFQNDGSENFTKFSIETRENGRSIAIGDMNGDTEQDIVAGYDDPAAFGDGDVVVFFNNGSEVFTPSLVDECNFECERPVILDFDGDNDMDFIMYWNYQGPRVFENDGSGNFTTNYLGISGESYPAASYADFDKDGDIDIVTHKYNSPTSNYKLIYHRNDGAYSFTSVDLYKFDNFQLMSEGDFDGDGNLDLVVGADSNYQWFRFTAP